MVCLNTGEEPFQPVFGREVPSQPGPATMQCSPLDELLSLLALCIYKLYFGDALFEAGGEIRGDMLLDCCVNT